MNLKKILIIQTAFIGDVIMSTPMIRAVKQAYPNSKVGFITTPVSSSLLEHDQHIDKIYQFDKKKNKIINFIKLIIQLRKDRYDIGLSMNISLTTSLIMFLSGIKTRVGHERQKLLTHHLPRKKGRHVRDKAIDLAKRIKEGRYSNETYLFISQAVKDKISSLFKIQEKKSIGIAPASIRFTKMWPKESFYELISKLRKFDIYLFGSSQEKEICDFLSEGFENVTNTAGYLSLPESAELIRKMDLMITNDSAPLHIANAVNTPVFAFFGPTIKDFGCYPYRKSDKIFEVDLDCRPCGRHGGKSCPKQHFRCMKEIKVDEVYLSVITFFKNRGVD